MYWLKACHKCGGDLFEESDIYGSYFKCLQCGHYSSREEPAHSSELFSKESSLDPDRRELEEVAAQLSHHLD